MKENEIVGWLIEMRGRKIFVEEKPTDEVSKLFKVTPVIAFDESSFQLTPIEESEKK